MSLDPSLPPPQRDRDHPSNFNSLMNSNAPRFSVPGHLPPIAALALFYCLTDLVDAVWQHYEPVLLDQIIVEMNTPPDECSELDLDFDDDIPF